MVQRATGPAVVAQRVDGLGDRGIVGEDRAGVAERAERLGREERQHPTGAEQPGVHAVPPHADRLRAVLDDGQLVAPGQFQHTFHVRQLAEQMYGQDHPGPRRHRPLRAAQVERVRHRVDVAEARPAAGQHDGRRGGDEREGRQHHLIARSQSGRAQQKHQRVGTGAHTQRVPGAGPPGQGRLEPGDGAAVRVLAVIEDRCQFGAQPGPQRLERRALREERHRPSDPRQSYVQIGHIGKIASHRRLRQGDARAN